MPKECSDLGDEASRTGDKYYRAVSEWVKSRGRSPELREKASILARVYDRTLSLFLECLQRLRRSPAVERQIETAVAYKTLLEKDVELLHSRPERAAAPQSE